MVNNNNRKSGRRLNIGWKHKFRKEYVLVPAIKGGGMQQTDVDKETERSPLLEKANSINKNQGLFMKDLDFYLASFSDRKLEVRLRCGDPFTVAGLFRELGSTPVGIYLHTSVREQVTIGIYLYGNLQTFLCRASSEKIIAE